ncbi:single-stranded DNA-binding protein [Mycoplasma mycoides]|uniref:Single-stranded DNA-binding protein n=2 Tax=Mycoplasma mycoides subsp. capri TaxID=40477 RepID=F4MNR9_MYCML|nr:single-stranded DNA-binding protein [Mycoplasma mycoides]ADH21632.1 single-strand binding protein [synthetic Mycoplasma mycoides JCVI-syn1.0]AMW76298.1 SsbA: single-strand DNA-binding protein [synthetic bacterium JCVI-Syn3.0]AMW76737.1 SsbA: single-strand DNA-binding protein [synthetic bacterium JCVI-Syn2.0]AVX54584.1 Single-stranded DNA-binding protein [synthetic bacterium JCVI-Syn3A]QWN46275.1 single-stranded DNA-binding protein [synthetic bacterium JCVI-Syn3B]
MNRVNLVGRITRDLELRVAKNGSKFVFFTVAVSEFSTREEKTNYIPCSAFDKTAENMVKYLSKGSLISVEGRITTRNNQTPDGKFETIVNVLAERVNFLEPSKNRNNMTTEQNDNFTPNQPTQQNSDSSFDDLVVSDDDELSILWE